MTEDVISIYDHIIDNVQGCKEWFGPICSHQKLLPSDKLERQKLQGLLQAWLSPGWLTEDAELLSGRLRSGWCAYVWFSLVLINSTFFYKKTSRKVFSQEKAHFGVL